ncbi:hypothetical protein [Dysosmobacter sp.]|uniref:hypothetical protein n=1 Tax=Dysosmobacter sp. TaxID=2591382 RepID=UPI003AB330F4
MKRRVFALVSLLILMLTMTAHAIEPYGAVQMPILSFNGTTANCYVDCKGENSTDTVKATLTLYQGKTYVDSWSGSGKGHALVTGNCTVKSGKSYTLALTYSINGISKPSVSATATCP